MLFGGQRHQRVINGAARDAQAAQRVRQLTGARAAQHKRGREAGIQQPGGVGWPTDSYGYYDVIITANTSDGFTRRYAGRIS